MNNLMLATPLFTTHRYKNCTKSVLKTNNSLKIYNNDIHEINRFYLVIICLLEESQIIIIMIIITLSVNLSYLSQSLNLTSHP